MTSISPPSKVGNLLRLVLLRVPELVLGALVAILVAFMTVSVFARYVVNVGIAWSDEASELLFIWIVFVGFAVGVKHRAHVSVQLLVDRFSPKWRYATEIFQDAMVLAFSLVFTKESYVTVQFSFLQRFTGLEVSMAWLYSATLVAGVMMTIYAAMNLWETIRGKRTRSIELDND